MLFLLTIRLTIADSTSPAFSPGCVTALLFAISTLDYAIVAIYMVAVVGLSFGTATMAWLRGRANDPNAYLLGGRDMPWWAVLGSIVATETSTATFLSVPGLAFAAEGDMTFLQLAFGYVLGRTIIAFTLLPMYFEGQLFTAYEVLEKRFGGATKRTSSLIFLFTRNLGDGLRLFLTAIVLEKVTGLSLPVSIIVIGVITIVYTFVGGMKAVVWNDCIQFVVYMLGGAIAFFIMVRALPGGWDQLVEFGMETKRFRVVNWNWDISQAYTIWAGVIGGAALTLGTHGADQMMVQRYLCTRGRGEAAAALIASGFVVLLQFAFFLLIGVALACFYAQPENAQQFERNDEVFASFIVTHLPVGLVGLTLAAVFSAAMSTLSSSLHSSAASLINDLLPRAIGDDGEPAAPSAKTTRLLVIVFGVIQVVIGIGAAQVSGSVVADALAIAGFSAGLLLGVFFLGYATKHVDQKAALIGLAAGVAVLLAVKFVIPPVTEMMPQIEKISIAWPWYALIGAVVTFGVAMLAQLALPNRPNSDAPSSETK